MSRSKKEEAAAWAALKKRQRCLIVAYLLLSYLLNYLLIQWREGALVGLGDTPDVASMGLVWFFSPILMPVLLLMAVVYVLGHTASLQSATASTVVLSLAAVLVVATSLWLWVQWPRKPRPRSGQPLDDFIKEQEAEQKAWHAELLKAADEVNQ